MKSVVKFLVRNKKVICPVMVLIVIGSFFGWEVQELKDVKTDQTIVRYRRIVFPWQPSNLDGVGGRTVNFHVRRWFFYGLYKVDVTGQMTYGTKEVISDNPS